MPVIADKAGVEEALNHRGFVPVTDALRRATTISVELGDIGGYEVVVAFEAYDALRGRVERLWSALYFIGRIGKGTKDYYQIEQQHQRLDLMRTYRFSETDPTIWALLLIHAENTHQPAALTAETPRINRLAHAMGFLPAYGTIGSLLGVDPVSELARNRYGAEDPTLWRRSSSGEGISGFIHFYHGKLGRLKRVSRTHKMALIAMEQGALASLDLLHTVGEIYRGWLMVGFSFLAPYALAPELVAAGGVATFTGIRAATQAENAATFAANAADGARAMFAIMDLGPAFFDLAVTLGRIFKDRPADTPLTPGEVFELLMSGLGAIPSARLGYFLMGVSIVEPFVATREFMGWLIQATVSIEAKLAAARQDLALETYDSVHTLILDLDE